MTFVLHETQDVVAENGTVTVEHFVGNYSIGKIVSPPFMCSSLYMSKGAHFECAMTSLDYQTLRPTINQGEAHHH